MRGLGPILAALLVLAPARGAAQGAAPQPLTLAGAVRRAMDNAPGVAAASYRVDETRARLGEARARLLPSLSLAGTWLNRTENLASFGLSIPGFPSFVPPFDNYDARGCVRRAAGRRSPAR